MTDDDLTAYLRGLGPDKATGTALYVTDTAATPRSTVLTMRLGRAELPSASAYAAVPS
jgi:hypothetical protein